MTAQVIKIRPIGTSDVSNGKHAAPPADSIAPQHDYSGFVRLYFVAQVLGFSAFTMVAVWMGVYRGGYGFGKAEPVFHWHPLLMNFGLMFLNGQAMMLYRGFRFVPKTITKPLHGFIQLCGAISTIVGIVAAWKYHDLNSIVHVHSIHSWIGISASFLFVCNYLIGLTVFGLPFAPLSLRQKVMPLHRMFGVAIFIMSICAVLMGLNERAIFTFSCWTEKGEICGEMWLANWFGMTMFAYAACVVICVVYPPWIRQPLPEDH